MPGQWPRSAGTATGRRSRCDPWPRFRPGHTSSRGRRARWQGCSSYSETRPVNVWYSNTMRGISATHRAPQEAQDGRQGRGGVRCIGNTTPPPDPLGRHGVHSSRQSGTRILLLCPTCQRDRRLVSLIDDRQVIERILRHLGLWQQGVRVSPTRASPEMADRVIEPWRDDPVPDDDTEPVMMYANGSDHRDRSGLPTCGPARSTTGPLRAQIGLGAATRVIPL